MQSAIMAEELMVVLSKSEHLGFGFSLLGTAGLPHVIYDIVENSPAAECGEVEAGDVILKVNETDVHRFTTKEVLKCLRLSADPVTLKLKRDPQIKAHVRNFLSSENHHEPVIAPKTTGNHCSRISSPEATCIPRSPPLGVVAVSLGSAWVPTTNSPPANSNTANMQAQRNGHVDCDRPTPRFEAFMMTGDLILNLSRTQQSSGLLPKHCKKVDSLRFGTDPPQTNSVPTSPTENESHRNKVQVSSTGSSPLAKRSDFSDVVSDECKGFTGFVRTSRSEDHLQFQKDSLSAVAIDFDDDVTSSLNTLLDTRHDSDDSNHVANDRIVWTYNAPVTSPSENNSCHNTDSSFDSPLRSVSPASPTSVSSSVMSSNSDSKLIHPGPHGDSNQMCVPSANGDLSVSEAVSNISSPDYQEEETMDILSARDLMMGLSDASDSDSTILVSEGGRKPQPHETDHKIVIQVKGPDGAPESHGYHELRESEDELATITEDTVMNNENFVSNRGSSPTVSTEGSDDGSDVDSLHSFHYSPKAVDIPSAVRLAKRLYSLDGFKKSDVSRHLSKNNEFSRAVADEYLRYFNFESTGLDIALRTFLKQFSLTGETQERERVLVHFSKRYLDCNPGSFNSQDAVHTLTCAIMLLNTDLHGQNIGRKMSCAEFIENLSELNDGENFPREILKQLYVAIKGHPLEWALDEEIEENIPRKPQQQEGSFGAGNPFLDMPDSTSAVEHKKGYVMRKCCYEPNAKKTPFGKRSWKMFYCTLRDLVLYLHKDEHGFRKSQMSDNFHNAIRIHHALATKAQDYTKKQHVFRLETADQAEYLFQTSDSKELQSWIDTINFVCASFSAQPLEGAVGSQRKFQRPLLPSRHTKFNLREQLAAHDERVQWLENALEEHRKIPPDRNAKGLNAQNYREKDAYLHHELKRYKVYANLLRSKLSQYPEIEGTIGEAEECLVVPPIPDRPLPNTNKFSSNTTNLSSTTSTPAASGNTRLEPHNPDC